MALSSQNLENNNDNKKVEPFPLLSNQNSAFYFYFYISMSNQILFESFAFKSFKLKLINQEFYFYIQTY